MPQGFVLRSPISYGLQERVGVKNPREFKSRVVTRMEVSLLSDTAVIRNANVFLIKEGFFCQKRLWVILCSVQLFLLGYSGGAEGCSGQQ